MELFAIVGAVVACMALVLFWYVIVVMTLRQTYSWGMAKCIGITFIVFIVLAWFVWSVWYLY